MKATSLIPLILAIAFFCSCAHKSGHGERDFTGHPHSKEYRPIPKRTDNAIERPADPVNNQQRSKTNWTERKFLPNTILLCLWFLLPMDTIYTKDRDFYR